MDLRERIVGFVEGGGARREEARRFGVSPSCAVKLVARVDRTGSAAPARQGRPPGDGKLAPFSDFLIAKVEVAPDITMPELSSALEEVHAVTAHPASLSRFLKGLGFTFKKSLMAKERERAAIRRERHVWVMQRQPRMRLEPHRLVFIDETSTTTKMTRLRGRAPSGERLHAAAPFGHWGTQTFIAGLRHDGPTAVPRHNLIRQRCP
ncbi:MAG: hypothetical protein GY926_22310 [bacterium]|nr:hypothetical protein [bacterium]